ncbi:hypothetical protein V1477_017531 [Vespula maculifrons]|uniref:Uncharacterized protein n=1 Tax=Vespula maculifrons TaxID=7453 RepID=A0ABD2B697_VESMC
MWGEERKNERIVVVVVVAVVVVVVIVVAVVVVIVVVVVVVINSSSCGNKSSHRPTTTIITITTATPITTTTTTTTSTTTRRAKVEERTNSERFWFGRCSSYRSSIVLARKSLSILEIDHESSYERICDGVGMVQEEGGEERSGREVISLHNTKINRIKYPCQRDYMRQRCQDLRDRSYPSLNTTSVLGSCVNRRDSLITMLTSDQR